MQFRYERKYVLSAQAAMILRKRVTTVMKPDTHSGGVYVVNNLYLDDIIDSFYHEKINGKLIRDKLRIRFYNNDLSFIRLERKHKEGELIHKESVPLTEAKYRAISNGDLDFIFDEQGELWQTLCVIHRLRRLRPVAEFSYTREAFIYEPGNVRITFDSCIGTYDSVNRYNSGPAEIKAPLMQDGYFDGVVELKYDGFLPSLISDLFGGLQLIRTEMSKYCYIRERGIRQYV